MQFEQAFNHIIKFEGGYVNHPSDPGGETNYGISKRFIQANGLKIKSIKDMTLQQAKEIYQVYFWQPIKAEYITDDATQLFLFDTAVNCGAPRAIDFLQIAINSFYPIAIDGKIGKETITTCNKITEGKDKVLFHELLIANRIGYYEHIIRNNEKLRAFLRGWINRVTEIFKNHGI